MFVGLGYASNVVESWASRLGLRPEAVAMLVSAQPALLEITPVTVKARLEGLSALFGKPVTDALPIANTYSYFGMLHNSACTCSDVVPR